MKSILRSIVVCVVWAGLGVSLHAQESKQEPTSGKVLLLRNGHVMEGDVQKIGTKICVREGMSEVVISAASVQRICADWDDAYAYLQTLVKLNDANDRVKIARWCHLNNLTDKALEQARKALELDPNHADAKLIVTTLERMQMETPKTKPPTTPKPQTREAEPPALDVSSETQVGFATKVQPILMNACAVCHCTGRGGHFQLERVSSASQKTATQRNLATVLTYIDFERPKISPLLVKAVMRHGKAMQPPIKDRQMKAFLTLQDWLEQTLARNPHMRDYQTAKKEALPPPPPRLYSGPKENVSPLQPKELAWPPLGGEVVSRPKKTEEKSAATLVVDSSFASLPARGTPPRELPAQVMQTTATVPLDDPYGPEIFNKQFHPKRE